MASSPSVFSQSIPPDPSPPPQTYEDLAVDNAFSRPEAAQVFATLAVAKAMEPPETEGPSPVEIIAGWLAHIDADELDRAVLEHLDGAPPMEVALRVLIGWASGAS